MIPENAIENSSSEPKSEFISVITLETAEEVLRLTQEKRDCYILLISEFEPDGNRYLEIIAKNQWYVPRLKNYSYGKAILFNAEFLNSYEENSFLLKNTLFFNNSDLRTRIIIEDSESEQLFNWVESIEQWQFAITLFDRAFLKSVFFELVCWCNRKKSLLVASATYSDMVLMSAFIELIEDQYLKSKKMYEYARLLSTSERKLNKITHQLFGISSKQMVLNRIILEAQRILVLSINSISEVAFLLGFDEVTYFIKFFQEHLGVTPGEYRKRKYPLVFSHD